MVPLFRSSVARRSTGSGRNLTRFLRADRLNFSENCPVFGVLVLVAGPRSGPASGPPAMSPDSSAAPTGETSSAGSAGPASSPGAALLARVLAGEGDTLGPLLESYRNYLRVLANSQLDRRLWVRGGPSDLVQEAMLCAYRDFHQFQGTDERQLLAWLRQILIHRLHAFVQHHLGTRKRDPRREVSMEELNSALSRSSARLEHVLVDAGGRSPSSQAIHRERSVELANLLESMSADYRDVIVLRNLRGLSFEEIAEQMGRRSGAVRMLWLRAIDQLRRRLHVEDEGA